MNVEKVRELFVELVANVPPERWQERLAVLVGDDEDTRQRVQLLLAAHQRDPPQKDPKTVAVSSLARKRNHAGVETKRHIGRRSILHSRGGTQQPVKACPE